MHSSETQLPKTKTSPTSVALNENGSMVPKAMNGMKEIGSGSDAAGCDKTASADKMEAQANGKEPMGRRHRSHTGRATTAASATEYIAPRTGAFTEGYAAFKRDDNRLLNNIGTAPQTENGDSRAEPIQCRLRISPGQESTSHGSKSTCNLDTIALVACQVADAQTRQEGAKRGREQSVSFTLPATILGKRPHEGQETWAERKVPRGAEMGAIAAEQQHDVKTGTSGADAGGWQVDGSTGTGNEAGRSAEEQVRVALKTSTCRSAMRKVMQELEDLKARVGVELSGVRQELEAMHGKVRAVERENRELRQMARLHEWRQYAPPHATAMEGGWAAAGRAAGNANGGGSGARRGDTVDAAVDSNSSHSQSNIGGGRGTCCDASRSGEVEAETEAVDVRRASRRGRGGVTKRKRLNWTAKENADFLRLVRGNAGMEEMGLRRMLAKFFAPKRTHEQCANHLRILRAQKKVPRAIGEAVPYRQKGAEAGSSEQGAKEDVEEGKGGARGAAEVGEMQR